MTCLQFFAMAENLPFSISLILMLAIAALEVSGVMFGISLSSAVEDALPDLAADHDGGLGAADGSSEANPLSLAELLSWLRIGQVPVMVLLVIFLTAFAVVGYSLQSAMLSLIDRVLPSWMAATVALLAAFPAVRVVGGVIAQVVPKEETSAVTVGSLLGRIAVITVGTARKDFPAPAKVKDRFGTTHHVLVEPIDDSQFVQGAEVRLIAKTNARFQCRRPDPTDTTVDSHTAPHQGRHSDSLP